MIFRGLRSQIEELLDEKGLAFADLADGLGLTRGRISHMMNQEMRVLPETIRRIAEFFDVEPTYFDEYVRQMLPEAAITAPGLITLGREILEAGNNRELQKVLKKIA
jgi:transcriptional regulator with XRE-family HTH domain